MASILGVVGSLAPKLLQLLESEYELVKQKNVRRKLKFVHQELEAIKPVLNKVAAVPWDELDEQVKVWARHVRDASYDMEDIVDTFLIRVDGGEPVNHNRLERAMKKIGGLFHELKARRDISGAIGDIQKQLQEVAERRARYKIDDIVAKPATIVDPRLSAIYKKASKLVGIEKPRDELIEMLSIREDDDGSSNQMKIISIVGFAGLGKTTLAKAVYDKVSHQFDCGAFVPVGHNPDPTKVLRDVLIELINDADTRKNTNDPDKIASLIEKRNTGADLKSLAQWQLINRLRAFLEGKRFFIVVDDIWDIKTWLVLKIAFVDDSDCRSRIIATTRNANVSKEIGEVYTMEKLPESESRKLLYTRTFGAEEQWPGNNDEVAMVSQKILGRCDGVPLAIITIGSCLAGKPIEEWSNVYDSIDFGHADDREVNNMEKVLVNNMEKILSFSYYDLPCHLRTCLLYLTLFPEDYTIDKFKLIWMWIAEGLVQTKEGKDLFQEGESYFLELINRGMIEPIEYFGILFCCRVHDMVHGMIRRLSMDENFFAVQDSSKQWSQGSVAVQDSSKQWSQGSVVRRLAQRRPELIQVNDRDMEKLRSFNAMFCGIDNTNPVSKFKLLRVLSLVGCRPLEGHLDTEFLGKLLHLRYLELMDTPIRELSKKIGHLKFLQTLVLYGTGIEELPTSLKQLTKLTSLYVNDKTRVPDWICELTSLVYLYMLGVDGDGCLMKDLGKLRLLRVLTIQITLQDEAEVRGFLEALSNLKKIEVIALHTSKPFRYKDAIMQPSFVLHCNNLRQLRMHPLIFSRLPKWINPQALPNLCVLDLNLSVVYQQDVEILGKFENLFCLFLYVSLFMSKISIVGGGRFQNLRYFTVNGLCQLEFLKGAVPRLEDITLQIPWYIIFDTYCFNLKLGLENLSALQAVEILLDCTWCLPWEVKEVEAELEYAVTNHPNRPMTLQITRVAEDQMLTTSDSMMEQQKKKALRLFGKICQLNNTQSEMWHVVSEMDDTKTELNPSDAKNKVQRFFCEYITIVRLVHYLLHRVPNDTVVSLRGHLLRLAQEQPLGHLIKPEQFPVEADSLIHDGDEYIMEEEIEAMERVLAIHTVEHPLLTAMFDALTYAFSLQGDVPRPQVITLYIDVDDVTDSNIGVRFGLGNNRPLKGQLVKAHIDCALCFPSEVEAVEAELTNAVHIEQHNNDPPTIEIIRFREDKMLNSDAQMLERRKWKLEDFKAMEEEPEILTIEYPQFAAMLDDQRYAYNLQVAMLMTQVLNLNICVFDIMVHNLGRNFGLLRNMWSLRVIKAHVMCDFCFKTEVEELESKLRQAVGTQYPYNPPTLEIIRYAEDRMVNSDSDSQMLLERQIRRRTGLVDRVNHQKHIHNKLIRKVAKIVGQKTNTTLSDAAKRKKQRFCKHFNAIKDRVEHKLLRVNENIPNRDLKRVTKENEHMEWALQILTVEYPRLAAMLEELDFAFSLGVIIHIDRRAHDDVDHRVTDEDVLEASLYDTEEEDEMTEEEVSGASLSDREEENERTDEVISAASLPTIKEADEVTED